MMEAKLAGRRAPDPAGHLGTEEIGALASEINLLHRGSRDVDVIAGLVVFGYDASTELLGRSMPGLPPSPALH